MRKLFRWFRRLFLLLLLLVAGMVMVNTLRYNSQQIATEPLPPTMVSVEAIGHLQAAIRIPTVSLEGQIDTSAALAFVRLIEQQYPLTDSLLESVAQDSFSPVLRWPGKKPGLAPVLLIGHTDVVPAEDQATAEWEQPPFSGTLSEDGYIWGRGTLDDKIAVIGILEAVEQLLREGFWPERTLYLAFGHDEEIGGKHGAQRIAHYFARQGIEFEYVLDEGQVVLEKALPGLSPPLAMIGIAEKGYVTLEVTAQLADGGHSSMPPDETAPLLLTQALNKLKANPFPARIDGATAQFLDYTGPEMNMPYRLIFANRNLLGGLLKYQFSNDPPANALIRTSFTPTVLRAGQKDNVIPTSARALVNFRILPGDDVASVKEYVEDIIADERISVRLAPGDMGQNPSPVSSTSSFGFQVIQKSIQQIFPQTVVAPALVIGATDARHYQDVAQEVYRFLPVQLTRDDLKRIHGPNERIHTENFHQAIRFYRQLVLNSCGGG